METGGLAGGLAGGRSGRLLPDCVQRHAFRSEWPVITNLLFILSLLLSQRLRSCIPAVQLAWTHTRMLHTQQPNNLTT